MSHTTSIFSYENCETVTVKVGIFPTCLVDQFFPQIAKAAVRVLERVGCEVSFDPRQTCCGQPAFNSGFRHEARVVARGLLSLWDDVDYVVAPSGSCTTMCRVFYPELFGEKEKGPKSLDPGTNEAERAKRLGAKVYEFSEFLVTVLGVEDVRASYAGRVKYHDACHALRELRVHDEPRRLLRKVRGLELIEMENADECCGFGGTFSVKFSELSGAMVADKVENIRRAGVGAVVSSDASCLMQIGGALSRARVPIKTLHLAEVLAGLESNEQ
jgi:L-lactate dehydrogenase complex protein LldE